MALKVGIDIGSKYIKVIEGYEKKRRLYIRKIGMIENPVEDFRRNIDENEIRILSGFLREYFKKLGIKGNKAICSVSGEDVILHYFEIPELSEEEIKSAVQLEALQVIPGGLENLEYDYSVFSVNGKKHVFLAGYPKEKCEIFVNILSSGQLTPLIMDIDGLAVANCYGYLRKNWEKAVCILNIGHTNTNLAIIQKEGFAFIRDIPFGGSKITVMISEIKQISEEEAEKFKLKKENYQEIKKYVEESCGELIEEVSIGLKYFESRSGEKPFEFLLTGGSSTLPGIKENLEKSLEVEIKIWNPFNEMEENLIPLEIKNKGEFFSLCLGLLTRKVI